MAHDIEQNRLALLTRTVTSVALPGQQGVRNPVFVVRARPPRAQPPAPVAALFAVLLPEAAESAPETTPGKENAGQGRTRGGRCSELP